MIKSIETFTPYEGDGQYIFISYAHADDEKVLPVISMLNERGYNVWYDDGIEVGSEWQECIASHLRDAAVAICFISNAYVKSDNCRKELHFAISKKKPIINVFLEDTQLTPGMELQISSVFALMKNNMSDNVFCTKLLESPALSNASLKVRDGNLLDNVRQIHKDDRQYVTTEEIKQSDEKPIVKRILKTFALLAVLGVLIAALIVGYFTGYIQRFFEKPVVLSPPSPDAVASIKSEELLNVAREYSKKDAPLVRDLYGLTDINLSETQIDDLSGLEYFADLYSLDVSNTNLKSLDSLPPCTVVEMNISGNSIASLAGIENVPNLEKLNAENCHLTDFAKLNLCQNLTDVNFLNCRCNDYTCFKPLVKITTVVLSNTNTKSVSQLLDMSSLRHVKITDSDLSGRFFKSFDNEDDLVSVELVNCSLDSLSGVEDFQALQSLTLSGCSGITDYSDLELLDNRTVIKIS